jgi:hypothetical protein
VRKRPEKIFECVHAFITFFFLVTKSQEKERGDDFDSNVCFFILFYCVFNGEDDEEGDIS